MRRDVRAALVLALSCVAAAPGGAAMDMFLEIEGVPGEAVDSRHPAWIEVDSFTWGVAVSAEAVTTRAGARPMPRSLVVRKVVDRASPPLYQACAEGRKLARAVLAVREPDSPVDDLIIELHDVLVSAVHLDGDAAAFPMEEISLDYGRITWTYTQSDGSGGPPTEITASWDVAGAATPPRTAAAAPHR